MKRYEILIVDPDTRKVVHRVTHTIGAYSPWQAAGIFAWSYGWVPNNNWILKAVEVSDGTK